MLIRRASRRQTEEVPLNEASRYTTMSDDDLVYAERDPHASATERAAIVKEIGRRAAVRARYPSSQQPLPPSQSVVVKDIDMPFLSMVFFMVKWTMAAIPVLIILALLWLFLASFIGGLLRSAS